MFNKATRKEIKLRLAIIGPSGSGKTFTALKIGSLLAKKLAVIDSEHGAASKYADMFGFDVMELESHNPTKYIQGIEEAEKAGYDVLVIDSFSHVWMGVDGILEMVDKFSKRTGNSYTAWSSATPIQRQLVEAILKSKLHVICTMRAKTEYLTGTDENTGKMTVKKVGTAPIQRKGVEYEFDIVADMDLDHNLIVSKSTRCQELDGAVIPCPGDKFANTLKDWLSGSDKETIQEKHSKLYTVAVEMLERMTLDKKELFDVWWKNNQTKLKQEEYELIDRIYTKRLTEIAEANQ